jgi:hypothetical protein
MKGDYTRMTFRPKRHFSGVRLQQGRVHVDADFNEQVDIGNHRDLVTTRDVVGDRGAPLEDAGFEITVSGGGLVIGSGRHYVDGILCENEEEVAFGDQPDLPGAAIPEDAGRYLAYLDVWERHISALEDDALREIALGGPDTATRTQTVWQVKLEAVGAAGTCVDFGPGWAPQNTSSTGRLRARATPAPPDLDECSVPPGAGFRRLENQLYRVEVHDPTGSDGPTFKWSRDNGTVAARLENIEGNELTVSNAGRDEVSGFAPGQWVELSDEGRVLRGEPGVLARLGPVKDNVLTVAAWPGPPLSLADFGDKPTVRRWDSPGALGVDPGAFVELEDGVEVAFSAGDLRTGDYWVIPARTASGDVEWPRNGTGPASESPRGIDHHFCPLAVLELAPDASWSVVGDCRHLFPPLTELTSLFYVGGDGQEAMPDPTDPGALLALPRPIEVGVANGEWPVEGATVRFTVVEGSGRLDGSGDTVEVSTGADGIASVDWEIDSTTQLQRATAALVDGSAAQHHLQIRFSANLSVASQVAYDPGSCESLAGAVTVQSAVETMSSLAHLYRAAGDGQEALPGRDVQPLRALVANGCGPLEGATVRFEVTAGDGVLNGTGGTVDVTAGGSGIAECSWQLGTGSYRQEVTATLTDALGNPISPPEVIQFEANLSVASQVFYDNSKCPDLERAGTVQEAIDLLCGGGGGAERGIKVERITLVSSGRELENDSTIAVQELAEGIRITCDHDIAQESVRLKPVVAVIIDLPYPMRDDDVSLWGRRMIGTIPLTVDAQNNSDNADIFWFPADDAKEWLAEVLASVLSELRLKSLAARLILKGNFVWAAGDPDVHLDGDVFGMRGDGRTRLRLPSGDGRRGGDLEAWFRLGPG